jgi:glycosyltransferase involved in cell wall biosynthesis
MDMKFISIVTGCYNEEENVQELYERVKKVMSLLDNYRYEHIFIDNDSKDKTVAILRKIAEHDKNVKIIISARNFGHIRSPYHALLQTKGDAVIGMVADLQDPPELIPDFIRKWEEGYKLVIGVKATSEESPMFFAIRKLYYKIIGTLSEIDIIKNFTGFGLY